jgi:hypothetical protein
MPTLVFNLTLDEVNMVIQGLNYIQRDSQVLMNKLSQTANQQIQANAQAAADAQRIPAPTATATETPAAEATNEVKQTQ